MTGWMIMKRITKEWRIGAMVVFTIVAAYFVINFLRGKDVFNKENDYIIYYENVAGLKASSAVSVSGFKAGTVKSVEYCPRQRNFKVVCSVSKDFVFPEDSRFEIYSSDIMGGKAMRVIVGGSQDMAISGAVMQGCLAGDMMASLMEKLPGILDSVGSALDSVSAAAGSLRGIVDGNEGKVRDILADLSDAVSNIESLTAGAGELVPDLKIFVDNMKAVSDALSSGKDDIGSIISDLSEVSSRLGDAALGDMAASLSEILSSLAAGEGSMGKLLNDDSLYIKINSLVGDADSLITAIKSDPKKYVRISVF